MKKITKAKFVDGYTYAHEHIRNNEERLKKTDDMLTDATQAHIEELKELYKKGVRNIFDVTPAGSGRNPRYTRYIAEETGVNIILSTSFYKEPLLPDYFYEMSEENLIEFFVKEITMGIEDTNLTADVIGEVGSSRDVITTAEHRLLTAAAKASVRTNNTPIYTHASYGTMGIEQVGIFEANNVDLSRVVIGHQDVSYNPEYTLQVLKRGVFVGIDTVGKQNYITDKQRLDILLRCLESGFEDRIVLSMDISRQYNMRFKGGIGYSYLLDVFIPMMLNAGISKSIIEKLMITNPRKWLVDN